MICWGLKFCECLSLFPWLSRPTPLPSTLAPDFPPTPPCRALGVPRALAPLPAALGWRRLGAKRQRRRKPRQSWISAHCWRISLMQQMRRTNLNSGGRKKRQTWGVNGVKQWMAGHFAEAYTCDRVKDWLMRKGWIGISNIQNWVGVHIPMSRIRSGFDLWAARTWGTRK